MFACARTRLALSARPTTATAPRFVARTLSTSVPRLGENKMQANDPTPASKVPNVSGSNATPTDAMGGWDLPLKEEPEVGERNRQLQAPNRARTWAASQQPREKAMTGVRFEQTIMEMQVRSDQLGCGISDRILQTFSNFIIGSQLNSIQLRSRKTRC